MNKKSVQNCVGKRRRGRSVACKSAVGDAGAPIVGIDHDRLECRLKSSKELALEHKILERTGAYPACSHLAQLLFQDAELHELQDYCNNVSIRRLNYNDHGPVHMRQVAANAIKMLLLLQDAGIATSLEAESYGSFEDSLCAVLLAGMCHDLGMAIGRQDHENSSALLAQELMRRILGAAFPANIRKQTVLRAMALEGILGHMGNRKLHSVEAGIVLIADGCDMTKGRSRIPMQMDATPKIGDIHKYSSSAIEKIRIVPGRSRPIQIDVEMNGEVGFFQVEEVLMTKIHSSPVSKYVEIFAGLKDADRKCYQA
ncbi:MAG: hypothetical protein PHS41_03870 [Victivallaceae bacterium]|nr:hypothetical protein [Victivallaceae bacterium]